MTKICVIAAFDENKGVGIDNKLPWNMPDDLLRFKSLTQNNPIIMGRKTFESLPSLLPNRTHIVLTHSKECKKNIIKKHPEVIVLLSWDGIYEWINEFTPQKIFVIGGPSLWKKGLEIADVFYLTKIKNTHKVDTFFPEFNEENWNIMFNEDFLDFSFIDFKNKKNKCLTPPELDPSLPVETIYIEDLQMILKSQKLSDEKKVRFANTNKDAEILLLKLITQSVNKEINLFIKFKDNFYKNEKLKWFIERFEEYKLFIN